MRFIKLTMALIIGIWLTGEVFAKDPLEKGLVGYWKFDEGKGMVAVDSSGENNDSAVIGATWVKGKFGSCLSFNGKNDYVNCGSGGSLNNITKAITIEVWVKPDVETGEGGIVVVDNKQGFWQLNTKIRGWQAV